MLFLSQRPRRFLHVHLHVHMHVHLPISISQITCTSLTRPSVIWSRKHTSAQPLCGGRARAGKSSAYQAHERLSVTLALLAMLAVSSSATLAVAVHVAPLSKDESTSSTSRSLLLGVSVALSDLPSLSGREKPTSTSDSPELVS